jgi:hypothetical protein
MSQPLSGGDIKSHFPQYVIPIWSYQISAINSCREKCDEKYLGQTEGRTGKTVYLSPPVERGYTNILVLVKSKYYTRYNTFLVLIFNWLFMSPPLSGWDIYKKCSVTHVRISEIKQLWRYTVLPVRPSVCPRYFSSHFSLQLLMAEIW